MKLLVINCGSSSIKYEVFEGKDLRLLAGGLLEKVGTAEARLRQKRGFTDGTFDVSETVEPVADHAAGFELIGRFNSRDRIFAGEDDLYGIGHRVVHGGERFQKPTVITGDVVAAIRELIPLAPLHNPANLLGIEVLRALFPRVPQVAVFDTMFHQTLPPRACLYALPYELYEKYRVRRYGFHGTSHAYVAREAAGHLGRKLEETNLIILHLGNGASAAAIQNGRSIDTSMGLTPLEGLVMGTRCGDLDPALHFYLLRETGMDSVELEGLLNSRSGLKGICGSNDMREILVREGQGDERARLAVDLFCYRIKKYIGGYVAVLGRVDAVVFTGGIGENAPAVRERVLEGLEHLGLGADPVKNRNAVGSISEIQPEGFPIKSLVIKTDEELEIARQTQRVIDREINPRGGDSCKGGSRTAPTGPVKRKPLGRLVGAFKTVSSKQINLIRNTPGVVVWQRNYYEHVIRDETDLNRIREYIAGNPTRWAEDDENPHRTGATTDPRRGGSRTAPPRTRTRTAQTDSG